MVKFFSVIIILSLSLSGCERQTTDILDAKTTASKPIVMATNYPLYFFASEIAGDAVDIRMPEIDGDPAMWVPSPSDLSEMQAADLIILNGAGYETWLTFTTLPHGLLVDTTADIGDQLLPIEETPLHQHGPEGEHSHENTAFTTWLNPQIAIEQARKILHALSVLVPTHAEDFNRRFSVLNEQLQTLDQSLAAAFSEIADQAILFSHPVYQYLQKRYRLNARSLHWEPDTVPGVRDWVGFQNLLHTHPANLMIWEARPSHDLVERLQQQSILSIVFEPAANRSESGDYFARMRTNLAELKRAGK